MKNKLLLVIILVLTGSVVGLLAMRRKTADTPRSAAPATNVSHPVAEMSPRVPAYQSAEQSRHLPVTLEPSQFFGKAREAYQVAKKIPSTLAQLPCYCHCDRSFGHKSLHTCFEDDHASHCAVCVDEALMAYQLQTEEKLTPEEVRTRIIENYSTHSHDH
jgi:hypothetical protein